MMAWQKAGMNVVDLKGPFSGGLLVEGKNFSLFPNSSPPPLSHLWSLPSFLVSTVFSPTLPRHSLAAQWICPKIAAFYKWAGQLFCFGFLCTGIWVISSSSTAQAPHFRAGGRQLFFSAYCLSILWPVSTSQGMLGPQWQVHQIKMKVSLNWFPPNSLTKLNFERMPLGGLFDSWASNRLRRIFRLGTDEDK